MAEPTQVPAQVATIAPAPEPIARTVELCVVEETDIALFTTYEFTLPRTQRGRDAFAAVKKIRSTSYKVGNIDKIIKLVKPFPYTLRVDTRDRITISVSSEAFEEEIEHEAPPFDDALDAPVETWGDTTNDTAAVAAAESSE